MSEIDMDIYSDNLHYYDYDEIKEEIIDQNIDGEPLKKLTNIALQEKLPKDCRY